MFRAFSLPFLVLAAWLLAFAVNLLLGEPLHDLLGDGATTLGAVGFHLLAGPRLRCLCSRQSISAWQKERMLTGCLALAVATQVNLLVGRPLQASVPPAIFAVAGVLLHLWQEHPHCRARLQRVIRAARQKSAATLSRWRPPEL